MTHCFSKSRRLLTKTDYQQVFDGAQAKASHRHFLLLAKPNNFADNRLGLIIAKKNVRLAVNRNHIKRLVREFFRHHAPCSQPADIILLARRGLGELDNAELSSILKLQWHRLDRQLGKTRSSINTCQG